MNRGLAYLAAVVLSLGTIAFFLVEGLYRWEVSPQLDSSRAGQAKHVQLYLDDLKYVSRFEPARAPARGTNDAGVVLNPQLHWIPESRELNYGSKKPIVSIEDRETIMRLRGEWMRKHARAKRMRADLSFFAGLDKFDYWDIESTGPIQDLIKADLFVPPPELPVPDVADLMVAVKLRLMMGANDGDPLSALKAVRGLARLMFTTENLQLVIAGIAMLDDERFAYRYFVDEKDLDPLAWTPYDRNITRRAHRAINATRGYVRLWTPADVMAKLFQPNAEPIGTCAALNEALPQEYALRSQLEPQWPFEHDLRQEYRRLDELYARSKANCRLTYLGHLVSTRNFKVTVPGPLLLSRLPYARKVFGLRLSLNGSDSFEEYNALAAFGGPRGL